MQPLQLAVARPSGTNLSPFYTINKYLSPCAITKNALTLHNDEMSRNKVNFNHIARELPPEYKWRHQHCYRLQQPLYKSYHQKHLVISVSSTAFSHQYIIRSIQSYHYNIQCI